MKKFLSVTLALFIIFAFIGCSVPNSNGVSTFENDLNVEQNNDERYNSSIYLTEDKFFFTSHNPNGKFGSSNQPYVYDLKTGKIKAMLDFSVDNMENIIVVGSRMYFIIYTYTSTDWGYCLFEYNLDTSETKRICETPNTVDNILISCCDDIIFYMCSKSPQDSGDLSEYEFHIIEDGEDRLIRSGIMSVSPEFHDDENGVYFVICKDNDWDNQITYFADKRGNITQSDKTFGYYEEYYTYFPCEYIDSKIVSGKFGKYYILEDDIPYKETDKDACGYKYKIKYYLYDTEAKEVHTLTDAQYWYYYL